MEPACRGQSVRRETEATADPAAVPVAARRGLFRGLAAACGGLAAVAIFVGILQPRLAGQRRHLQQARQYALDSPRMARRVLVLGDSFLQPWPFATSLERQLLTYCRPRNIGLINSASPGIGPVEYRHRMELNAGSYRPTHVLLFYHVGNDLTDTMYRVNDIPSPPGMPKHRVEWDWQGFVDQGIAPELVRLARRSAGWWPTAVDDQYVNPFLFATALEYPFLYIEGTLVASARAQAAWNRNADLLQRTFRLARAAGARTWVIAIPSVAQMGPAHRRFLQEVTFRMDPRVASSRRPQQLLAQLCQQQGVLFLDLLPAFLYHPQHDRLFLQRDDHFSALGHAVAFELLRRRILEPALP